MRLTKDGRTVAETTSDNYGDFKFDKLDENSGSYLVEISAPGRTRRAVEAKLGASINLGEITGLALPPHAGMPRESVLLHQGGGIRGGNAADQRRKIAASMLDASTPLIFPQLGQLYQSLAPWAEAALRVGVGLALVPHGLRMTFGLFPSTGLPVRNLAMLSAQLDRDGYRPGKFWAPAISITQLVAGPMLALGLFTRLAAIPIVIFLLVANFERWRVGGYFWNKLGARIHPDVDLGRILFPGARRRRDLPRSSPDRT